MRECGQNDEAEELRRGALADALAAWRTASSDTAAALDQRLEATFAAEAERVANATVLAELLAPLVAKHLHIGAAPMATAAPGGPGTTGAGADQPSSRTVESPIPARARASAPASIADFIDEMITQERAAPRDPPMRRAS